MRKVTVNFDGFGVHLISVRGYWLWADIEKIKRVMYEHRDRFFSRGKGDYTFSVNDQAEIQ